MFSIYKKYKIQNNLLSKLVTYQKKNVQDRLFFKKKNIGKVMECMLAKYFFIKIKK